MLDYRIGYWYWLLSVIVYQIIGISVKINIGATLILTDQVAALVEYNRPEFPAPEQEKPV